MSGDGMSGIWLPKKAAYYIHTGFLKFWREKIFRMPIVVKLLE
jgi:hypothetical protein